MVSIEGEVGVGGVEENVGNNELRVPCNITHFKHTVTSYIRTYFCKTFIY